MAGIEFKDVARRLSCREFAEAEGLPMKSGRLQCPLHGGRNYNMAFCNDGWRVYCHKCGRSGDVVTLAAAVWRLNQRDAAVALNQRFRLGLDADAVDGAELERRRAEREAARQAEAEARAARTREYSKAADELREAERAVLRRSDTDWTPELTAAVQRMARAQDGWNNLEGGVTR